MAKNRLFFLSFCGFLWSTNADLGGSYLLKQSEDDWTKIVLLPDTGGVVEDSSEIDFNERFKRQVNSSDTDTVTTDTVTTSATSLLQPKHNLKLPDDWLLGQKGYIDNQELVNNVDINDENINKIQDQEALNEKIDKSDKKETKGDENFGSSNDTHKYYKSQFKQNGEVYFKDLDMLNSTGDHAGKVMEHNMLSKSYRRAATIQLNFKFPFYGHEVENITIATGGFLYTGDYVHSWLAATQYIAPLMANFDTSKKSTAKIRFLDTGDYLVVEWKDVFLQDREKEGPFTFQVILKSSGDIMFAYNQIPLKIGTIQDEEHPVKVGLSDAYIIDRTIFFVRRKTIYEYHRVNMKNEEISNLTAIVFTSLPTCNRQTTCETCLGPDVNSPQPDLKCHWCPKLKRCSDGMDRARQKWLTNNCDKYKLDKIQQCKNQQVDWPSSRSNSQSFEEPSPSDDMVNEHQIAGPPVNTGGLVTLVISILLVMTFFGWIGYAYFYPHTWSGQILIKYRPGAWRWRQSGARYTAASIHM